MQIKREKYLWKEERHETVRLKQEKDRQSSKEGNEVPWICKKLILTY